MTAAVAIGLITGTMIGAVGIGGILLAPLLTLFLDLELQLAMASSSLSFLFTGLAGTAAYARKRSIDWRMAGWLSAGLIPAAFYGARTNTLLSADILTSVLGTLIALSGLNTFTERQIALSSGAGPGRTALVVIGLAVGFGSALTGTGGPVLLLPILALLGLSPLKAIGVSQVSQLPIAVFAAGGFILFGRLDWQLGLLLGLVQVVGVFVGARIAHSLPAAGLKRLVALALIGAGSLILLRVLTPFALP